MFKEWRNEDFLKKHSTRDQQEVREIVGEMPYGIDKVIRGREIAEERQGGVIKSFKLSL